MTEVVTPTTNSLASLICSRNKTMVNRPDSDTAVAGSPPPDLTAKHGLPLDELVKLSVEVDVRLAMFQENLQTNECNTLGDAYRSKQKGYWYQICSLLSNEENLKDAKNRVELLTARINELSSTAFSISSTPATAISNYEDFTKLYTIKSINSLTISPSVTSIIDDKQTTDLEDLSEIIINLSFLVEKENYDTPYDYRNTLVSYLLENFETDHQLYRKLRVSFKLLKRISNWLRYDLRNNNETNSLNILQFFSKMDLTPKDLIDLSLMVLLNKLVEGQNELGIVARSILDDSSRKQKASDLVKQPFALKEESEVFKSLVGGSHDSPMASSSYQESDSVAPSISKSLMNSSVLKSILKKIGDVGNTPKKVRFSTTVDTRYITPENVLTSQEIQIIHNRKSNFEVNEGLGLIDRPLEKVESTNLINGLEWKQLVEVNFRIADFSRDDVSITRGGIRPVINVNNISAGGQLTPVVNFDIEKLIVGGKQEFKPVENEEANSGTDKDGDILSMLDDDDELMNYNRKREHDQNEQGENDTKRPKN